jgi:ABC-type Mn2+/Zn2+ transport system permease subunit
VLAIAAAAVGVTGGLLASFWFDLPMGATVVVVYALLFLVAAAVRRFMG